VWACAIVRVIGWVNFLDGRVGVESHRGQVRTGSRSSLDGGRG
jgi:hypothetical protein